MRLDHATWPEVETYLKHDQTIILPTGSTEQHGPIGLIGTDAICAEAVAMAAAEKANVYVAPTLAYAPAPFNTSFPGTISISAALFADLFEQIVEGLLHQGFRRIYVLNGHGANLDPLEAVATKFAASSIRIRSWWDFDAVNRIRDAHFGQWEGMHATPSEVSIAQAVARSVDTVGADDPPELLSPDYMRAHARDRHGPPEAHRAQFPDGRVGSHSALASPEVGVDLLNAAAEAAAIDVREFSKI